MGHLGPDELAITEIAGHNRVVTKALGKPVSETGSGGFDSRSLDKIICSRRRNKYIRQIQALDSEGSTPSESTICSCDEIGSTYGT